MARRVSDDDDSVSQDPGYLGSSGRVSWAGDGARDDRGPGDSMARALDAADEVARARRGTGGDGSCRWLRMGSSEFSISGDCAGEGAVTDKVGPGDRGSCPDVSIDVLLTDYPSCMDPDYAGPGPGASECSMIQGNEQRRGNKIEQGHARELKQSSGQNTPSVSSFAASACSLRRLSRGMVTHRSPREV